ncbi:MAG: methyltransferase domain-containing protein [Lachnospiraceae bacterium]|nr:methyltransferase domain-containing protein [Lachnospiraceae bacterium]
MSENIREIVFDCLLETDVHERKSHLVMREVLDKYDYLDNTDKNFIKRVFEGTIQKRITLDYALNRMMEKPLEKNKIEIIEILRMGAYQVLFMDRVPDSAACDEAVKLTKKRSRSELSGFVNGVLRAVSREKAKILSFDDIDDDISGLSVKYSMPEWIVRMLNKEQKQGEALINALAEQRPTVVRITDAKKTEELLKNWEETGIAHKKSENIPNVFEVSNFHGMGELPGFAEGLLYVQDESSMLSIRKAVEVFLERFGDENKESNPATESALEKKIGEANLTGLKILDTCAAPGGKSVYIAELLNGMGEIISLDVSEDKVSLLRENMERLGHKNVSCSVWDATVFNPEFENKFDIVICDVPCSGLGVISRKSDLKYRVTNESMISLCELQKQIADNAKKYVKKNGILLYSTCTIHKAENEKTAKYICSGGGYELICEKQLLPNLDNTDGFYFAVLIRK